MAKMPLARMSRKMTMSSVAIRQLYPFDLLVAGPLRAGPLGLAAL